MTLINRIIFNNAIFNIIDWNVNVILLKKVD